MPFSQCHDNMVMRKRNYYMALFSFETGELMENSNVLHLDNYIKTHGMVYTQADENTALLSEIREIKAKLNERQPLPLEGEKTPFIAELWHWVEQKKDAGEILPQTFDKYKCVLNRHIAPFFDKSNPALMLSQVSHSLIKDFIGAMKAKGRDSTLKEAINSIMKPFMTEMVVEGKIVRNPTDGIKLKGLKKAHKRAFTDTERQKLEKVAKETTPHWWVAIPLLAYLGIRKEELLALSWDDVDFKKQTIYIHKTNTTSSMARTNIEERTKTEAGTRTLPIPPQLLVALKHHYDEIQGGKRYWIIGQKRTDKPVNTANFSRTIRRWREKAGIPNDVSCHAFRHAYTTKLALENTAPQLAMKLLGHSDPRMYSMVYTDMQQLECSDTIRKVQLAVADRLA